MAPFVDFKPERDTNPKATCQYIHCDDVCMKNMKILILQKFFMFFDETCTWLEFGGWLVMLILQ